MVGCVTLVRRNGMILGIKCSKGRGIILPGGKWDGKHESFVECAKRELQEETGLVGSNFKLVFSGESEEGYFTYAFTADVTDFSTISYGDEIVVDCTWSELKESGFGGYYELMQMAMGQTGEH